MPLVDLDLLSGGTAVPDDVSSFLREAERRVERFQRTHRIPGFVPSHFARVYGALHALAATDLAPGRLFCEWGSGFGVVACRAAMLDLDACGIEIEGELVDAARQLADDFSLPAEFIRGSFIPRGGQACVDAGDGFAWLTTDVGCTHEELGVATGDLDVVFAYPGPTKSG
jgi:hypothetical protein